MKTHRFDAISFISGVVITLLGLAFLIPQTPVDVVEAIASVTGWFWPVLLLVIGGAILLPVLLPKDEDTEKDSEKDAPGEAL
ncbi:MAG TPA: hypothetical protein VLA91_09575 [Acidimicrobiia bacterium]|nr:hypothetical protein [Acidimicrobiia bacterium]